MCAPEQTSRSGTRDSATAADGCEVAGGQVRPDAGELAARMGIVIEDLTAQHAVARMPVEGNTQITGRVHGGAYAVLAETVASMAAGAGAPPDRVALGVELSASHVGGTDTGYVHARCRAVSLGRRICVHEVTVTDDAGRLLSTVRVTNYLASRRGRA
ncbi:PaaI family thioesterase [Gordonia jinhuaensis]|uniref:Esterase n=1 Tax=Gordonia jinhuaensis TaxID=1517702 RepID=A0A916TIM9_9ACTN|nr:PaaI family thioesterase [Gordonia jinhuaensis]GGB47180.1 putative esterase [Gordonia jinhuaensis]